MQKIDFNEAREALLRVMKSENENNSGDLFGKYAAIYMAPTFNVIDTVNLLNTDSIDSALAVGSSGHYIYELLLKGVRDIDAFDINVYQYFYYELFQAGIKYLDYDAFMSFFCPTKSGRGQDFSSTFDSNNMAFLLSKMDGEAFEFWGELFVLTKANIRHLFKTNLFRKTYYLYPEYLKKYSSIYSEDVYSRLKDILLGGDYKIDYRILGIGDISEDFHGRSYDAIFFGNILQYYKDIQGLNNVYRVNDFIKGPVSSMLNDGGVVQVDYGFELASVALSKEIKRAIPNLSEIDEFLLEMDTNLTNRERRDGIITNLIRKYGDDYSYHFISGVETDPDIHHSSENVVLSYVKK